MAKAVKGDPKLDKECLDDLVAFNAALEKLHRWSDDKMIRNVDQKVLLLLRTGLRLSSQRIETLKDQVHHYLYFVRPRQGYGASVTAKAYKK